MTAWNHTYTMDSATESLQSVGLRGWAGFNGAVIDSFGYYLIAEGEVANSDTFVYGEHKQTTEDGVFKAAGNDTNASRYLIDVSIAGLEAGTYKVGFIAKLGDGTVVRMYELTLIIK